MSPDDIVLTPLGVRFKGLRFPCSIGRTGVTETKLEGDGGTPAGIHRITGCLYRPDRMRPPASWATPIRPFDGWSENVDDPRYNQLVRLPHDFSHEHLRRGDHLYDIVLLTDWNFPDAVPGRGSAIFLHNQRRPGYPTAGCIAFRPDHMAWIAHHAEPGTRVFVQAYGRSPKIADPTRT